MPFVEMTTPGQGGGGGGELPKGETQGSGVPVTITGLGYQPTTVIIVFLDADDVTSAVFSHINSYNYETWAGLTRNGFTGITSFGVDADGFHFTPNTSQVYNKEFYYLTA